MNLLIAILFLCTGVLAGGIGVAFLRVDRVQVRSRVANGDSPAQQVLSLLRSPVSLMMVLLVVENLGLFGGLALGVRFIETRDLPPIWSVPVFSSFILGVAFAAFVLKWTFSRTPFRALLVSNPVLRIAKKGAALIAPLFGFERAHHGFGVSIEAADFFAAIESKEAEGVMNQHDRTLLERCMQFCDRTAGEVMIPFSKVPVLKSETLDQEKSKGIGVDPAWDRVPVMDADGRVCGVADEMDRLFQNPELNQRTLWMHRPVEIQPQQSALSLIPLLRESRGGILIVVDGERKPLGVVRREDQLHFTCI